MLTAALLYMPIETVKNPYELSNYYNNDGLYCH